MFTNSQGWELLTNMQASKRLPPSIHMAKVRNPHTFFIYLFAKFTPGEHSPGKVLHKCLSCRMANSRRLFSFRKKLTNTRLGISGHRLTQPNMGQILDRYFPAAGKGVPAEYGTMMGTTNERAPLPTLLLAVRASRHDVVTYAVLVRRGGKH